MYAVLEKFDMQGMKKVAEEKFGKALKAWPISNRKHKEVLDITPIVYDTTPEKRQWSTRSSCGIPSGALEGVHGPPNFKTFMAENIELVLDVFEAMKPYKAACKRCKGMDKWKADHVACGCGWGERC